MLLHLTHPVASRNGLLMPCTQQHGHPPSVPEQCLQRLCAASKTYDRHCNQHSRVKAGAGEEPGPLEALQAACEEEGVDLVPMAYLQDDETWEDLLDNEEVVWDPTLDVPERPAFSNPKTVELAEALSAQRMVNSSSTSASGAATPAEATPARSKDGSSSKVIEVPFQP
ncbi:hypothetical protein CVIRNUC_010031 [Coccomyxa viridis]|uniref:Uncharacterized protein n=1 Tax=Coccomyxa viridis TaxID=1274662 RepID=A0AAV1IJG3_9CHLO|nr:hypothetical protein CVIRNUC_010031 [Coccomyxa viridis]